MLKLNVYVGCDHKHRKLLPAKLELLLTTLGRKTSKTFILLGKMEKRLTYYIELNILSDSQMRELNHKMRGIDKATDVLSVCLYKDIEMYRQEKESFVSEAYGEIDLSIEKCVKQAAEIGQSVEDEFLFLVLHGILHIFGYDHETPAEEKEMMEIAYEILGRKK